VVYNDKYYNTTFRAYHNQEFSEDYLDELIINHKMHLSDFHEKIDEDILFDSKIAEIEEHRSKITDEDMLLTITSGNIEYKFLISDEGILYCWDKAMKGIKNDLHKFLKKNVSPYFKYTITSRYELESVHQYVITKVSFPEISETNVAGVTMLTTWMTKEEVQKKYPDCLYQPVNFNYRLMDENDAK